MGPPEAVDREFVYIEFFVLSPPKLNAETLSDEALACWQIGCASSRTAPTSPPRTLPNCRACPRPRRAHTHAHTRTHARAHGRERGKGERQGAQAQRPREQAPPVTPKEPAPTSHVKSPSASFVFFHYYLFCLPKVAPRG